MRVFIVDQLDPLYSVDMSNTDKVLAVDNMHIEKVGGNQYNLSFTQVQGKEKSIVVTTVRLTDYLLALLERKTIAAVTKNVETPNNIRQEAEKDLANE